MQPLSSSCPRSFYSDFGPLNLALFYRYCCRLYNILKARGA